MRRAIRLFFLRFHYLLRDPQDVDENQRMREEIDALTKSR